MPFKATFRNCSTNPEFPITVTDDKVVVVGPLDDPAVYFGPYADGQEVVFEGCTFNKTRPALPNEGNSL